MTTQTEQSETNHLDFVPPSEAEIYEKLGHELYRLYDDDGRGNLDVSYMSKGWLALSVAQHDLYWRHLKNKEAGAK